ncbi:MAG: family 16 glycosylhydrolase [Methylotenera sp.]|nr:family 16 glycosylhydrolase [Oligoflexia bacterium]
MMFETSREFILAVSFVSALLAFSGLEVSSARADEPAAPPTLKWKMTWNDEFNGPQPGDDPSCFETTPQCLYRENTAPLDCPESSWNGLRDLNKCNWAVYHLFNSLGNRDGAPINAFNAHQLIVRDGELVLKSQSVGSDHSDCGRTVEVIHDDPRNPVTKYRTMDCPFISGGLESRAWGQIPDELKGYGKPKILVTGKKGAQGILPGFRQKYGRFEIRAKLSTGPGSWPAYQLQPQDKDGPADLQNTIISLMDARATNSCEISSGLEFALEGTGKEARKRFIYAATSRDYPEHGKKSFYEEFHVYALEWEPLELRFYVDQHLIGVIHDGAKGRISLLKRNTLQVPSQAFYLTLTSAVGSFFDIPGRGKPQPDHFTPQTHHIDYVRVYQACEADEAGCQQFEHESER